MDEQELSPTCESHPEGDPLPSLAAVRLVLDEETYRAIEVDPVDAAISSTFQPAETMLVPRWLALCSDCLDDFLAKAASAGISIEIVWLASGDRTLVQRSTAYYALPADEGFQGVPFAELRLETVDWTHRQQHVEERATRKGTTEYAPTCEEATEAALDPLALIGRGSAGSVKVVGAAPSATRRPDGRPRVLKVFLVPKEEPPASGDWWGATAMEANRGEQRRYWDQREERK